MKWFFFFLFAQAALCQKLIINKDHSEINFEIEYLSIAKVSGRFEQFYGSVELIKGIPTNLKLVIESDSIDTGNGSRDGHLKGTDFLSAKKYPEIVFQSSKVIKLKNKYEVNGTIEFQDRKLKQKILITLEGPVKDTWGKKSWFIKLNHQLSRKELGIIWNKTLSGKELILGDIINLRASLQLQEVGNKTAGSKHKTSDNKNLRVREKFFRGEIEKIPNKKEAPTFDIPSSGGVLKIEIPKPIVLPSKKEEQPINPWIAFMLISFFGFLGVTGLAIVLKKNDKLYLWSEEKLWKNMVFDLFLFSLIFIYAWAVYEIMPK